jgi:hypothetical protein
MKTDAIDLFAGQVMNIDLALAVVRLELIHIDLHSMPGLCLDNSIETILLCGLTSNHRK